MIGATLSVSIWLALVAVLGLIISTALYLKVLTALLMGTPPDDMPTVRDLNPLEATAVIPLAVLSLIIGLLPGPFLRVLGGTIRMLSRIGIGG